MKSTHWKKISSKNGLLYVILDQKVIKKTGQDIFLLTSKLAAYGIDIFQLRIKKTCDKDFLKLAQILSKIIHKQKKIFLVNDRVDIAYLSNADGIHLGAGDMSVKNARKILGSSAVIGKTVHSYKELCLFQNEKINYLSIGPIFKTKTKPELNPLTPRKLESMLKASRKLTFVIGGISLYNIQSLVEIGIKNIALCRGLILEKKLKTTISKYKQCLQKVS